jgi:hypothetical protein
MKNHFYMPWVGNKREEVESIYEFIKDIIDKYDIIVEPYCGSQSISLYIALNTSGKKFILNDNNKYLKEMYELMKDDQKIIEFNENVFNKYDEELKDDKEAYQLYIKNDNLYSWFISNKFNGIRPGLWPQGKTYKKFDLKQTPIYEFYKNNDIEFYCDDAIKIYEKYKSNDKALILLDPPYLSTINDFYLDSSTNIYEYLYNHNIKFERAKIVLILENIWIIKMLFQNCEQKEYDKTYNGYKKKKVKHVIISN